MDHPTAQPAALESACRAWQALLGADGVLRAPDVLARYGRTTLPDAPSPVAVLRPLAVEQVAPVVRVAAAHRVPLYPISRGKNWGWGDACPVTEGQAILDLSALDRIVAVDEELGYAVVQPGVTQGQLADHLRATDSAWWLDGTAAGPDTSVLGNILERGGTRDERSARVCGMEVVLADGTSVRTGYGHYPGSRVTHVARWGVGPSLDGLFSQSNLGVVTELGFWLQPRPAHAELGYFAVPDEALEIAIDALRPFRIRGVIPGQPLQLAPAGDRLVWLGITTLQGHPQAVAAHREELIAAMAPAAKVAFPRPEEATDPAARAATLATLGLPANPFFDNILRRADPLAAPRMAPEGLLAWLGGPTVQRPTGPPTSTDPLDHDYGFYFAWPTCPALGREVRALLDLVRPILAAHGCPQLLALRFVTGRSITLVMRIAFDRKQEERRSAARACHRAILEATLAAGYPPARVAIDGMECLDPAGDSFWQLVRRLKHCLDPDGILAPGRYLPVAPGGRRDAAGRLLTEATDENAHAIRRLFAEVFNAGNVAVVDDLTTAGVLGHDATSPEPRRGREAVRQVALLFRSAFPDLRLTLDDLVTAGDKVVARWTLSGTHQGAFMGAAPTGKRATTGGIVIYRLEGGRIAEYWGSFDALGLLRQLGAVPPPTDAPSTGP